jgi:hypothetical protein
MRKLTLSKKTISSLNDLEMGVMKGGSNYCYGGVSGGGGTGNSCTCPDTTPYTTVEPGGPPEYSSPLNCWPGNTQDPGGGGSGSCDGYCVPRDPQLI